MGIIDATIFYINLRTLAKILYYHCVKYFSIRRFLVAMVYFLVVIFMGSINFVFRLIDEIIFPNYKNLQVKQPVYIISNPRSGTTFLHRLMCLDDEKFVYTLLYHTIVPSITFFRIVDFFGAIDRKIGRPLRRFFDWIDDVMFGGWDDIHPTGFNKSEEDEGLYFMAGISPSVSLISPYLYHFRELYILDKWDEKNREKIKKFYKATLQRWMYALGSDKTFLCKTVMSTGRLHMLMELFPDVKIIYLVRNPYNACPSFISMFASTWSTISPDIPEDSPEYREWSNLAVTYYKYFNEQKKHFKPENWITVKYDDMVADPYNTVINIYDQLKLEKSQRFLERLRQETNKARKYESKHSYSLEQFGIRKEDISAPLASVYEEFGFEK